MVNDNIITKTMYHEVRGIIRGEIGNFNCIDCKRHNAEHYPCDCGMMYGDMLFKPREEYLDRVAKRICESIGEPLDTDTYEREEVRE